MTLDIATGRSRSFAIDLLRSTVMIIMVLDHVRDFFHSQALITDPLDLQTTTPILFFTRWITHFCAPVFVFLSGCSAYLYGCKKGLPALSSFLIKRGCWLICVEIVLITFALTFNPLYSLLVLQVVWAIGIGMIMLGLLIRLPLTALFCIGLLLCFGHNLLDYPAFSPKDKTSLWWLLLHSSGSVYPLSNSHLILVAYAFIPWTGVMITGYCFGRVFEMEVRDRIRACIYTGTGLIGLFLLVRSINMYGDPAPWSVQKDTVFTLLSFLNVSKYPASMQYICLMLGPAILLLGFMEKVKNRLTTIVSVYGRVPFFYFIIHLYLIHLLCMAAFYLEGYTSKEIISPRSPFFFRPPSFGFSLLAVYAIWIVIVVAMYPICSWYNRYKSTHTQWWLSYL
ncbi:MAG: heparan-alpha-glucosaminide N-acetyltransferase domain-containing protein [Chitinophagaceae bacterium]